MRIKSKFNELNEKKKAALVTFITAGDPSLKDTKNIILELQSSGADIIELGIPFSDPMADGPTIQLASERAIKCGATLTKILNLVKEIRKKTQIPIILFGYYNPFFIYGLDKFSVDAKKAGIDGVLVVDLPPEESYEFKKFLDKENLDLVFLLAPTSTSDRIKLVSKN
jgi:tryptophan synthase alpha chain